MGHYPPLLIRDYIEVDEKNFSKLSYPNRRYLYTPGTNFLYFIPLNIRRILGITFFIPESKNPQEATISDWLDIKMIRNFADALSPYDNYMLIDDYRRFIGSDSNIYNQT